MGRRFALICLLSLISLRAHAAPAPDDRALAYIPAEANFYAMFDSKAFWNLILPFAPPNASVGGKPALPDPKFQPLVDFIWNTADGPISIGAIESPVPRFFVVAPIRPGTGVKSSFNQAITVLRNQGVVESTVSRVSGNAEVTVIKLGKMAAPTTMELLFVTTPDAMLLVDSEGTMNAAAQAATSRRNLLSNLEFTNARARANVGAGQLVWIYGKPGPSSGVTLQGPLTISVRSEPTGVSFGGFIPFPRR